MTHRPWNYKSGIHHCETCDGTGYVASHRRPTIDDPYPEQVCEACDRPDAGCCAVCGFDQHIPGTDCLACETVALLFPAQLFSFDVDAFSDCLKEAVSKARADALRRAA